MLVAGLVTLIQLWTIGPIGARLPCVMGTSSGFIGVMSSIAKSMGGGVIAYGAIMGACLIGGLFETVLGALMKPLRRFHQIPLLLLLGCSYRGMILGIQNSIGGSTEGIAYPSITFLLLREK